MRAALIRGPGTIILGNHELAPPPAGWLRLQIDACGICGSNLHAWRHPDLAITSGGGPEPGAAGHEIAATVVEGDRPGRRVVVEPNMVGACGECTGCRTGTPWFCRNRSDVPSWGFAEQMVVPARAVFDVPTGIPTSTATLVEPLACGVHALRWSTLARTRGLSGARVAVLGCGVAGLLTQVAARHLGADVVAASGRHPHQRDAAERLGADLVVDSAEGIDRLRTLRPDIVVEAVGGRAETFEAAAKVVRPSGEVVVLGLFDEPQQLDARRAVFREMRFFFAVTYGELDGRHDFEIALEILDDRDLSWLVSDRFPLDEIGAAFVRAGTKEAGTLRVVVEP